MTLACIYYRRPEMKWETSSEGLVTILDDAEGKRYHLDVVASRIWSLLDRTLNLDQVTNLIMNDFDVTSGKAKDDVKRFVRQLFDLDLILRD